MKFTTGLFKSALFASIFLLSVSLQADNASEHSENTRTSRPVNEDYKSNEPLFLVIEEELKNVKKREGTDKTQAVVSFWALMADQANRERNGKEFVDRVKLVLSRLEDTYSPEIDLIFNLQDVLREVIEDFNQKKDAGLVIKAQGFLLDPSQDPHKLRKNVEDFLIERINKKTAKNVDASRLYLKLLAQHHKGVSESKDSSAQDKEKALARYTEIMNVISPKSQKEEPAGSTTKGDGEKNKEEEKASDKKEEPKEKPVDPEAVKRFEGETSKDRYKDWRKAYDQMENDVNKDVSADERKYVEMEFTDTRGEKGDYEVFKDKNGDVKGQGGLYAVPKSFKYKDAKGKERSGVQAYRALLADKSLTQAQRNVFLKKNLFKVVGGSVVGNAEYNAQGKLMFRGSYSNDKGRVSTILYGKDAQGNYGINHVYQPRRISSGLAEAKGKTKGGVFDSTLKLIGEGEDPAADGAKKILAEATKTKALLEGPTVIDSKVRAKLGNHKIVKIGDQEVLVKVEDGTTKMLLGFEESKGTLEPVYYCIDCEKEVRGIAVASGHKFDDKTGTMILPKETKAAKIAAVDTRPRGANYGSTVPRPNTKIPVRFGQHVVSFEGYRDPKTGRMFIWDYNTQGQLGWIPVGQNHRVSARASQDIRSRLGMQRQSPQRSFQSNGQQPQRFDPRFQTNPNFRVGGSNQFNQFNQFNNGTPINRRFNNSNQGWMPRAQRIYRNIYDP